MKEINSIQNELIKSIDKLHDKKTRINTKKFIVEGYHLVEEANKHHLLQMVLATKMEDLKKYEHLDTYLVSEQIIKKLSTTINPQGIIGIVKMPTFLKLDLEKENLKIVVLDGINDPGNLGSIVRTAAAFGFDALIASFDTVDIYNEKSIRATQGAIFKIPFFYEDLKELIPLFKKHHITCIGTTLKNAIDLKFAPHSKKLMIAFGNEARGMSEEIINLMDVNVKIKMDNDVESLNVLSASSIVMYHLK